ncbi:MAG: molecular chaperone TorD family protein [Coriobacteriaceae bacterium]|nr:molecular chaperone TorD family protein [Coriobacteriaceae bacterium]
MDAELRDEISASCTARIEFYRFLASIFFTELSQEQVETVAASRFPIDDTDIGRGYELIARYMQHRDSGTRQQLAVDYARVFLGAGSYEKLKAPPYESVFTSEVQLLMQEARDDAVKWYRRYGLALPEDNTTPEDHVSFEMQFMALLIERSLECLKAGDEDGFKELACAQRDFFDEHLANWLPRFADAIDQFCKTDFYHGIAALVRGLLQVEPDVIDGLIESVSAEEDVEEAEA